MKNAGKDQNPFHAPTVSEGAQVPIEQHRAIQEVQAAMIIAKKFPRDQHAAFDRIMTACERPKLAEAASYNYPKGKTMVTGPTIRLAEVMAQNWGNMEFGIRELSQDAHSSEVQAYAWDMETNVRQSKTFVVPHKMKAHGSFKKLDDPRDIYEHVANMGARRLRACILGVIPGDIVDAAVIKCEETLKKGDGRPLEDMIRGMLEKFKKIEISKELIEARLQHKSTAIVRSQLVELGKIYNSIKGGMSKRSDWFDVPKSQQSTEASDLTKAIQKKTAEQNVEPKEEKRPTTEKLEPTSVEHETTDQKPIKVEEIITPDFRSEWIRLQGPGFSTYFHKNRAAFEAASIEIQEEARVKWLKLYPETPWPLSIDSEIAIDLSEYTIEELNRIHARIAAIGKGAVDIVERETGLTWGACRNHPEMAREFLLNCFQEYQRSGKDPAVFLSPNNGDRGEDLV